jgi:hypothetical protein
MHTTALCSPSRSCIITGRNHHANATAAINELATGYPGYNGQIPFENGFLSEMLQQPQLYVDGQLIANAEFPVTTPIAFNPGGLTCGANPGSAIVPDYQAQAPFPYTGTLHTVTVALSGDLITDTESEMRMAMARQ